MQMTTYYLGDTFLAVMCIIIFLTMAIKLIVLCA